ncbi:MFS transporter [Microbacterium invictum]|uniref:GPH family glycoside/pentoside/hexuronide:cation symporter n=1 Tax=Microbacterium invictum TaxID=515415 RepID=A0AA40SRU1_9MICO|nr:MULTISPECIES: MFS transporter [Microbacterium]MBB4141238.1 GPH family glycoside/pentoside/hexuronide:cation symporter [Microbacterium invictum]
MSDLTPDTASPQSAAVEDPQTALPRDTKLPPFFSLRFSTRGFALAVNVVVLLQLTFYATDVLGLPAALVGGLFLAAKLFDGVTDLLAGFFIDRTKTRWGKARPYELFLIPLWLLTIAIFSTPEMSTFWQATYLFVLFTLINSVCATFLNASEAVYLKRSLRGEVQYAKVLSRQGVFIILVAAIASIMLPQLMASWGTEPGGWTRIALVYGIPLMLIGLVRFFTIKELPEDETDHVTEERLGVAATLRALFANKYVFILALIILLANIVISANAVVGAYFFKYILGDLGLLSLISLAGIVVPLAYLLFPLAVRTIGALNFVRIGLGVAIVGYAMVLIAPNSLAMVVGGQLLGSFTTVITMLVGFFMIQAMAYGEWKSGKRIDAVTNSIQGFASKVGQGIAAAGVGVIMGAVGYDGLAASQTPAAESAIVSLYSLMPLVITAVMFGLTYLYRVDKHMGAIQADLAAGVHSDTSTIKI